MKHIAATIALGPILFLQGKYVRRTTPNLPEPLGDHKGRQGSGAPLRLLILGDSAALGIGAATQSEALSGQLLAKLGVHFDVSWTLIAKNGATTSGTLRYLSAIPAKPFDVVVTSLGVNDLTSGYKRRDWLRHQSELISLLKDKFAARLILLTAMPPMHLFPSLPQPLRWYMGEGAKRFTAGLLALTQAHEGCQVVTVDYSQEPEALRKEGMAADGFHPGPPFYTLWAEHLAERIVSFWPAG